MLSSLAASLPEACGNYPPGNSASAATEERDLSANNSKQYIIYMHGC